MREIDSYKGVLAISERVGFRLDDVLREASALDFSRPFLPEGLARCTRHVGLTAADQLLLNQIAGHTYLCMFGLVEEFILPFVLEHARAALGRPDHAPRALLNFANEEAKHIELFRRFRSAFERGFSTQCEVVGPAAQVVELVLSHRPLGVALTILHIEWMTQRHYVESVRGDDTLEPHLANLLKQHWLEEAQHAKLDTLLTESIAAPLSTSELEQGVDDYLCILRALDGLLEAQSELDVAALERARSCAFPSAQRQQLVRDHRQALRATFVASGISHPKFRATVAVLGASAAARVDGYATALASTLPH